MAAPVWFFDLDNTLHDASYRIFSTINGTMTAYVMHHLKVDAVEAGRLRVEYWNRYGATLLGLVRHHGIDAHHFLRATHDFSEAPGFADLVRAEHGLAGLLRRLPGRKVLLTNAPARYAAQVLVHIGLHRHFARRYAIEQMRIHQRFRPKPSRSMLRALLARERVRPSRAVLIEDSLPNLRSARAVGMRTVLVTAQTPRSAEGRRAFRPTYVDLQLESVMQLVRRRRFLR